MKGRKWIVGFLVLLGTIFVAVNLSKITVVETNEVQSSGEVSNLTKAVPHNISKQTQSKQTLSSTSDLSIDELSELSKQYIVQCKDPYAIFDNYSEESGQKKQDKVFETWSKSSEFGQQLALALIHSNLEAITFHNSVAEGNHDYINLSQLVKNFPNSHLAHYFLVAQCVKRTDCNESAFDDALAQDPYNGALWKLTAIRYAEAGKVELALMAIENSIAAPNNESYWGETIHLFEQALATTVEMDELTRQISAIGYSAALVLPNFKTLLDFCREHSTQRADISNACLAMGSRDFQTSKNLLEQHIGLATQKLVYKLQNNQLEVQKIEALHQEFRESTNRLMAVQSLVMHDKDLSKYWWENILLYGETQASQLTFAEAVRLSSDPDYDPCPNGKIETSKAIKE